MKTFGHRLRALRKARNWSQEKLGFELGVTKATVSKWETAHARPTLDALLRLKKLFADHAVTLDSLAAELTALPQEKSSAARIGENAGHYEVSARDARTPSEMQLLLHFRHLSEAQRKALLVLLGTSDRPRVSRPGKIDRSA